MIIIREEAKKMADLLRSGHTMLNLACPVCNNPLFRNKDKEIWFNTPSNKKKMMNVPYGEDPIYMASSFFVSDEGVEVYKHLKELLKNK